MFESATLGCFKLSFEAANTASLAALIVSESSISDNGPAGFGRLSDTSQLEISLA